MPNNQSFCAFMQRIQKLYYQTILIFPSAKLLESIFFSSTKMVQTCVINKNRRFRLQAQVSLDRLFWKQTFVKFLKMDKDLDCGIFF